jgi:hypothetical protein
MTLVMQLEGNTLKSGIFTIKFPEGTPPAQSAFAFAQFKTQSIRVAKAAGATQIELAGIAITNPDVAAALSKQGFTPKIVDVPAALGGGSVQVLTKTFPVRD